MLVERDPETSLLAELVADTSAGAGAAVLLEGGAGAGKSALLGWAADRARWADLRVHAASGGELEIDIPFGVARTLLGELAAPAGDLQGAIHALFYAVASAAEEQPAALIVDDLHWVDEPSLRWLAYLVRRVADLPVVVVLGTRPGEALARPVAATLMGLPGLVRVPLRPLSAQGVAALAEARLGGSADAAFGQACIELTGGNPLFTHALLDAARDAGLEPGAGAAERLPQLSPPAVRDIVARALRAAGEDAARLAPAVAVAGAGSQLRLAAELAGLELQRAEPAADALRRTGILAPQAGLAFVHPVLRTALLESILPGDLSRMHSAAARLLAAEGGPPESYAAHLLHSTPAGDPGVVEPLRVAARGAAAAGAPDSAAVLLRRALAEPPEPDDRTAVCMELGRILLDVDPAASIEPLAIAGSAAGTLEDRVALTLDRSRALFTAQRSHEAVEAVAGALADLPGDADRGLRWRLEGELLAYQYFDDDTRAERGARMDRLAAEVDPAMPEARPVLVHLAIREVECGTADAALAYANAAWADGGATLGDWTASPLPVWVSYVYIFAGDYDRAEEVVRGWQAEALRLGAPIRLAYAQAVSAEIHFRRGDVRAAEADALTGWSVASEIGMTFVAWWALLGVLLQARAAGGDFSGAAALLDEAGLSQAAMPDLMLTPSPREARAHLWLAEGRLAEGLEELLAAAEWFSARIDLIGASGWRVAAAETLAALSRFDEARALAEEAHRAATRFGGPIPLGTALRARGITGAPEEAIPLLSDSADLLAASPARLEHARSLLALGAALRRAGRRVDARAPLAEALDIAASLGARPLAEAARQELGATGAKLRRERISGRDALTASELRAAQMAAAGLSNPDIAQRLFVTRKTVEKHLGGAYAKLGVSRREDLGAALGGE